MAQEKPGDGHATFARWLALKLPQAWPAQAP
jgi:hypothetical protein